MSQSTKRVRPVQREVARLEFIRVLRWLERWGYSLVDSDRQAISDEQADRLSNFYAEEPQ